MSDLSLSLTSSFAHFSSSLPFGTFNTDASFQSDTLALIKWTHAKLGGNTLKVELNSVDVGTCMEESAFEYSSMVNAYSARSILADVLGAETGSLSGKENKLARLSLAMAKRKSQAYSSEAIMGGTKTLFSSSINAVANQQAYDLTSLLSSSGEITGSQRIEIKQIFHFSPTAAYRFFDTTSAINYLHNQFKFESFTPETVFYLLPVWEDVLRAQMLETSHNVRRSNYSYDIVNNIVRIYPVPDSTVKLYFTYYKLQEDPWNDVNDPWVNGISNLSNIPFGNITYSKINSIGRQWCRRFALSLAKEILGQLRSKIKTIPIPNSEIILNGDDLIFQAREEQSFLRSELKEVLEATLYQNLLLKESEASDSLKIIYSKIPLYVYKG